MSVQSPGLAKKKIYSQYAIFVNGIF